MTPKPVYISHSFERNRDVPMEWLPSIKESRFYYEQRITRFSSGGYLVTTPTYFSKQFSRNFGDFANGLSGTLSRSSEMIQQLKARWTATNRPLIELIMQNMEHLILEHTSRKCSTRCWEAMLDDSFLRSEEHARLYSWKVAGPIFGYHGRRRY